MPLVHFPATATFAEWSMGWGHQLSRPADRRQGREDRFGALCDNHLFFYAGPCCYTADGGVGNAALYFAPGIELGRTGCVTPFDSGALESPAKFQPFRTDQRDEDWMWQFFRRYRVVLDTWRDDFAEWLSHCYDDPERYIESGPDRHAAGEPDRTRPQYLLQHNGSRGASRYGGEECGDRRTWTWEIRVEQPVSMSDAAVVQVGFADFEVAQNFADEIEERTGRRPRVHPLDRDTIPSQDSLYQDSQNVLTWMMSNEGQTTSH